MPLKADLNGLITKQTESVNTRRVRCPDRCGTRCQGEGIRRNFGGSQVSLNDYGRAMEMARVIDERTTRVEGLRVKQARANRARQEGFSAAAFTGNTNPVTC